jgi:beta-glucosidase
MTESVHRFPHDFKWGTATSAHQVEGDNKNNQWWAWERTSGRIKNGDTSGAARNWWNSAEADFDRMSDLGLNAHRLSIEWSRVEPCDAAIDRYRAILLELRWRVDARCTSTRPRSRPLSSPDPHSIQAAFTAKTQRAQSEL